MKLKATFIYFGENMKEFLKNNIIVFIYAFCAILMEVVSITFIGCKPHLEQPFFPILLLATMIALLMLFKKPVVKITMAVILLLIQAVMNVGFVYLYDSNGTYFEWSMFNQRNDARGTIEDLSFRTGLIIFSVCVIIAFLVASILVKIFCYKKGYKYCPRKLRTILVAISLIICSLTIVINPTIQAVQYSKMDYVDRFLYGDASNKYQRIGISSNAVYEFVNGTIADGLVKHDNKGIEQFIYEDEHPLLETSQYFGISKNNNLVYILVESFEWYVFLQNCTPEQSQILYPNINRFLSNSVYADNFYAREKTDTSELLALLGSNPTGKFTNYDFPNNSYPWSLPNMFRQNAEANGNEIVQIKSFHQNDGDFYNRNKLHKKLGFEELVDIKDMTKQGLVNTWKGGKGERNLDSKTLEVMQDEMFPATADGEQYMTFWLTFTMHGYYEERQTLKNEGYYSKMDEVGAYPAGKGKKADYLRTYAAAVMDFDRALGIMFDKLEANGDLDNTTIVMFSDHNTYYNNLSYYAKDIDERYNSELYRIPFMIYDKNLVQQYKANEGNTVISKFTTTADMIPTIYDLFGIKGYRNLYYGTSMFIKDVESIIFSRAYGIFVTDKLICYGANNLIYKAPDYEKADYDRFIKYAKILLNKQEYLDKIYYNNYFKNHTLRPI